MNLNIKPGDILIEEFLAPLNISPEVLASKADVPLKSVLGILKGEEVISNEIANKFAELFETSVDFWLNLEGLKLNQEDAISFYKSLQTNY
jgi:antitoxin HigA-1